MYSRLRTTPQYSTSDQKADWMPLYVSHIMALKAFCRTGLNIGCRTMTTVSIWRNGMPFF